VRDQTDLERSGAWITKMNIDKHRSVVKAQIGWGHYRITRLLEIRILKNEFIFFFFFAKILILLLSEYFERSCFVDATFPNSPYNFLHFNLLRLLTPDAFAGFCLMICLTDSNELFLVVIFSFKIRVLFVSLVPC
jgi:hypothetical protein